MRLDSSFLHIVSLWKHIVSSFFDIVRLIFCNRKFFFDSIVIFSPFVLSSLHFNQGTNCTIVAFKRLILAQYSFNFWSVSFQTDRICLLSKSLMLLMTQIIKTAMLRSTQCHRICKRMKRIKYPLLKCRLQICTIRGLELRLYPLY